MTQKMLSLEIPQLLPQVKDEQDQCLVRLQEQLSFQKGIEEAALRSENGKIVISLHYNPDLISLQQVERLAKDTGVAISKRYQHETLRITGMDCADCARSIEHVIGRSPGIITASLNYAAERMRVEYDQEIITHKTIVQRIQALGYQVEERRRETWIGRNRDLLLAILSGVFLLIGFLSDILLHLPPAFSIACYLLAYLSGGYTIAIHGISAFLRLRFDVDLLMVVAAIGAAILGEWAEGALLLFLFSLGHALEHTAMDRARHAVEALGHITPKTARVRRDGREEEMPVEALQRGDIVITRPGERIPVDGAVLRGESSVDQSAVTGESVPVEKGEGESVYAGTLNGEGSLEITVTKLAQDTTLARVLQLVEQAQTQKSPTQQTIERISQILVPSVLGAVLLMIVIPPLLGLLPWQEAFLRAMTMLVAASPCALAIATPSVLLSAIARAARGGVLIKGGMHLENLGRLRALALDKTGTVTTGKLEVTDIVPTQAGEERELLRIAAALESRSSHPLAQAVVRRANKEQLEDIPQVDQLQTIMGKGVRAALGNQTVSIGNRRLYSANGAGELPTEVSESVNRLEQQGKTTMIVQVEQHYLGVIALSDQAREAAGPVMQQLKDLGIKALVMLTGDNQRVAEAITRQVGMTEYHAQLLPEQKVEVLNNLLRKHERVGMVGDGINDAPALATATVGIAMGAGGTDVALETADVALMADDLSKLPFAVGLGRASRRILFENLIIAFGVIAVLFPSALFGITGIGIAILLHEGSTLLVVFNALRLLGYTPKR